MFQLILVIISIALTAAVVMAAINYIPWWYKSASDTEQLMRTSMAELEQVYDVTVRAANGQAPATLVAADGGLMTQFGTTLKFTPAAPAGFMWSYGTYPNDGSRYSGLNYFCLKPLSASGVVTEGVYKGMDRARGVYSREQVTIAGSCGSTTDAAKPTAFPVVAPSLTVFVRYTPGVNL